MGKGFEVLGVKFNVVEGDVFIEERNEYEEGRVHYNYLDLGATTIQSESIYDENNLLTKVESTVIENESGKVKKIKPKSKGANPYVDRLTTSMIEYDEKGRIIEISRNGVMSDQFIYTNTGRTTHVEYSDTNNGLLITRTTTNKIDDIIKKTIELNGEELLHYSLTKRRNTYTSKLKRSVNGTVTEMYMRYTMTEDGKKILINHTESETSLGFRYKKELVSNRYNDNDEIEYEKFKEDINGNVSYTENSYIYRDGKLVSIIDTKGFELLYCYTRKGYDIERRLAQDISSILNHLFMYDITKSNKKTRYHFLGSPKEYSYSIERKMDASKDEFCYQKTSSEEVNDVSIHYKKGNKVIDLSNSGEDCTVVVTTLNKDGQEESTITYKSSDLKYFLKLSNKIIESKKKEIEKFESDIFSIIL